MTDYTAAAQELFGQKDKTSLSLEVGSAQKPQTVVQDKKTARTLGVDLSLVQSSPEVAKLQARMKDIDALNLKQSAPKTNKWLAIAENAAISHDDVENLSAFEQATSAIGAGVDRMQAGYESSGAGFLDAREFLLNKIGVESSTGDAASQLRGMAKNNLDSVRQVEKARENVPYLGKMFLGGLESLAPSLGAAVSSIVFKNPALAYAQFGIPTFGNELQTGLDQRLNPFAATAHGIKQGGLEAITEMFAFAPLMKAINDKNSFIKTVGGFVGRELFGEEINTLLGNFESWTALPSNQDKNFEDFASEQPRAVVDTFWQTLFGAGATGSVLHGTGYGVNKIASHLQARGEKLRKEVAGAHQAVQDKQSLDNAIEILTTKSKLHQLSPEDSARYVKEIVGDKTVSISSDDAATFFQENEDVLYLLKDTSPDAYRSWERSQMDGSDMVIPMDEYAASLSEYHAFLSDKIHINGNETNGEQAQEIIKGVEQRLQEEASKVLEGATDEFAQSANDVRDTLIQKMVATKRFTEDTAQVNATLFSNMVATTSKEMGILPHEFMQQFPLRVSNGGEISFINPTTRDTSGFDELAHKVRSGRVPTDSQVHGQSLMEFLHGNGGLQDQGGELSARDLPKKYIKKKGITLDEAALLAHESGYLDERDIDKLLAAVDSELAGNPVHSQQNYDSALHEEQQALADIQNVIGNKDITELSNADIKRMVYGDFSQQAKEYGISESEAERQYDAVVAKYKGTDQWMKAPNGEGTKLNERQWVQVRTPAFREWFGEWENAGQAIEPISLTLEGWTGSVSELAKKARGVYTKELQGKTEVNNSLGANVLFTAEGKGEAYGARGKVRSSVYAESVKSLRQIIHSAVRVQVTDADGRRTNDSRAFHTLVSSIKADGKNYAVKITVREALQSPDNNKYKFYDIGEVEIKESPSVHGLGKAGHPAPAGASKRSVAELAKQFKIDIASGVSKVVDENGEPMVVYHGTDKSFDIFDTSKFNKNEPRGDYIGEGFYFTDKNETANKYAKQAGGNHVINSFLNIKDPFYPPESYFDNMTDGELELYFESQPSEIRKWKQLNGYDGLIDDKYGQLAAFNPNQIKSAISNTGQFNSNNDNIMFQRPADFRQLDMATLPDSMNEVANHTSLAALKGKEGSERRDEYLAAKNDGDVEAALNVVDRVLKPAVIENIRKQLDPNKPIYIVPVRQREGESMNALPVIFASRLAEGLSGKIVTSIVKTEGGKNTDKKQVDRLMDKHGYEGDIPDPDGQYIIVDDNFTSGNTVVPLIELIQSQGGVVPTFSTLAISRYGKSFKPKQEKLDELLQQTGLTKTEAGAIIGHDLENLTGAELQIILNATRQGDGAAKLRGIFASRGTSDVRKSKSPNQGTRRQSSSNSLNQGPRGFINFGDGVTNGENVITLLQDSNLSTFVHESAHLFFEIRAHLAAQAGASDALKSDVNTLLKWGGIDSLEQWHAMSRDEQRHLHEQVARGFESYLMEGKAPTPELNGVFSRMRAWMVSVYHSLKNLNVSLNDDVRQVFDRMLATDEALQAAKDAQNLSPLFETQEQSGMDDADWALHLKAIEDADADGKAALSARAIKDMKYLDNAKSKAMKALQTEGKAARKAVREEVSLEVMAQRVNKLRNFLARGDVPYEVQAAGLKPMKIDTAVLKEMYGDDPVRLKIPNNMKSRKEGTHPDVIASWFGYDSGDAMIRDIADAPKAKEVIEEETDKRVLERYGDMYTPEQIEQAAMEQVHATSMRKVIQQELNALDRLAGRKPVAINVVRDYAREVIARLIVNASGKSSKYLRAERKAAKATHEAIKKSDTGEAARQKQVQVFQQYLYSESVKAAKDTAKILRYVKKFNKKGSIKNIDASYVDQLALILDRYDFHSSVTFKEQSIKELAQKGDLHKWIAAETEKTGMRPQISDSVLNRATQISYKHIPMEELRAVYDALKTIENFGRNKKKLMRLAKKEELNKAVEEMAQSMADNNTLKDIPDDISPSFMQALKKKHAPKIASLISMEALFRRLDGDRLGSLWNTLFKPLSDTSDIAFSRKAEVAKEFRELVESLYTKTERARFSGVGAKRYKIAGSTQKLTKENIVTIALYHGSETGRQRLSNDFTPLQLSQMFKHLDDRDIQLIEHVWQSFEEKTWADLSALEREINGKAPEKVAAMPFTVGNRQLKGGYLPIKYDPARSERFEVIDESQKLENMLGGNSAGVAATKQGAANARKESLGYKLRYDLGVYGEGMNEIIQDVVMRRAVIDANRIMKHPTFSKTFKAAAGTALYDELRPWLEDIAVPPVADLGAIARTMSGLRKHTAIVAMGMSVKTAAINITGYLQSFDANDVGAGRIAKHAAIFFSNPHKMKQAQDMVFTLSPYMANRANTFDRDVQAHARDMSVKGTLTPKSSTWFILLALTDKAVAIPTWQAAYEAEMARTDNNQPKAIDFADHIVRSTQGGGREIDLAMVQRGRTGNRELYKAFTMFYSFFNATLQRNIRAGALLKRDIGTDPLAIPRFIASFMFLNVLPATIGAMMAGYGADDDEDKLKWGAAEVTKFMAGQVPVVRDVVGFAVSYADGEYFPYRATPLSDAGKMAVMYPIQILSDLADGEMDEQTLKKAILTTGIYAGLPARQTWRTTQHIMHVMDGESEFSAYDLLMGEKYKK